MSVFVLRAKAWWFWFRIRARERRWLDRDDFRAETGSPAETGIPAESEPARGAAGAEAVCRQGVETVPPLF
jgi:hypothetical protein